MNMMMPISNRLFASAVADGVAARRPGGSGRSTIIEAEPVVRRAPRHGAISARAGELELSSFWARARKHL
jgi:hypothetical protein